MVQPKTVEKEQTHSTKDILLSDHMHHTMRGLYVYQWTRGNTIQGIANENRWVVGLTCYTLCTVHNTKTETRMGAFVTVVQNNPNTACCVGVGVGVGVGVSGLRGVHGDVQAEDLVAASVRGGGFTGDGALDIGDRQVKCERYITRGWDRKRCRGERAEADAEHDDVFGVVVAQRLSGVDQTQGAKVGIDLVLTACSISST